MALKISISLKANNITQHVVSNCVCVSFSIVAFSLPTELKEVRLVEEYFRAFIHTKTVCHKCHQKNSFPLRLQTPLPYQGYR